MDRQVGPRRNFFGPKNGDQPKRIPTLLDIREAAALLHISAWKLYELARRGQIPHFRVGGKILFSEPRLADWLESHAHGDDNAAAERISLA